MQNASPPEPIDIPTDSMIHMIVFDGICRIEKKVDEWVWTVFREKERMTLEYQEEDGCATREAFDRCRERCVDYDGERYSNGSGN